MWLVKGEVDSAGDVEFTQERNVFMRAKPIEDIESILKENNWSYVRFQDEYYIVGQDVFDVKEKVSLFEDIETDENRIFGSTRRPMREGLLNTAKEKQLATAIIQQIIKSLLGKPKKKGEHLCFCVPGDPLDSENTVIFHKTILQNFLQTLGYEVECINEGLAIIFAERPVSHGKNGEEQPFTGISFSFGAGLTNVCLAFKKLPLITFSVSRSGDWIDEQSAVVCGTDISSITRFKEAHLDLSEIDDGNLKQATLNVFYQEMIRNALVNFANKFNNLDEQIDAPLEIVIAGGTASVPGFLDKFKTIVDSLSLPFSVKTIRMALNPSPLHSVANGCLVKATASSKKHN